MGMDQKLPYELLEQKVNDLEHQVESFRQASDVKLEEDLLHSQWLLKYVIEHDRSAIALLNRDLKYIYVSQRFLSDYNITPTDILGKSHYEVFPDLPDAWIEVHKKALKGEVSSSDEDAYEKMDGTVVWVRWECRPWYEPDCTIGGIILYTEVITRQKEAELELIRAKEKAEESDHLKTAFLNNMSHEIRTPLNSIVGFAQLLSEPGQPARNLKIYSGIISENSDKLIGIVSDVIEISRIHANLVKVITTNFDIVQLLTKMRSDFSARAERRNIDLVLKQNIPTDKSKIICDKAKLQKIFNHLTDNALKYTIRGSVVINCEIQESNLLFSVSDTGIGIEEDQQKIIFEPFRQLESGLSREFGGNGLGLTIVKAYTEALGGTISLKSEKDKGTVIGVTIPVSFLKSDNDKKSDKTNTERDGGIIETILIVEDEYSNYRYLYELLHSDKLRILHANNGQEAIDICKRNDKIRMILMDIKMPVMDGTSATKMIKEFRPELPVVAQTAYVQESEKSSYLSVFDDMILKPINKNDLKEKMRKYISV